MVSHIRGRYDCTSSCYKKWYTVCISYYTFTSCHLCRDVGMAHVELYLSHTHIRTLAERKIRAFSTFLSISLTLSVTSCISLSLSLSLAFSLPVFLNLFSLSLLLSISQYHSPSLSLTRYTAGCNCSYEGRELVPCNPETGVCTCKPGYTGTNCTSCQVSSNTHLRCTYLSTHIVLPNYSYSFFYITHTQYAI